MAKTKPVVKPGQGAPDYKSIAGLAIGSLVVVLVSLFLGNILVHNISFNNRVLSKKSAAANQLKANVAAVASLENDYNQLGSKTQLVSDALPNTADFPALVAMTEVMAGTSGVRLKIVTAPTGTDGSAPVVTPVGPVAAPTSASTAAGVVAVPQPFTFVVTVEGSYDNVLRFLSNVELSSRPLKLISVKQSGTAADQTAEIQLTTFYQAAADLKAKTEVVK